MRLRFFSIAAVFFAIGVSAPAPVFAQVTDDPPEALPDLAPREFEIRGALEIRFPSLERQPLAGFNPPPRLLRLPQGRVPFTLPYKQATVDLPPGPLPAATPPPFRTLAQRPALSGSATITLGTRLARTARIDLARGLQGNRLTLRARYEGLEGGVLAGVGSPNGTRNALQRYDRLHVAATASRQTLPVVNVETGVYGDYDSFQLFGLRTNNTSAFSAPDRSFFHVGGHVGGTFTGDIPASLTVRGTYARMDTQQFDVADDPRFETAEVRFEAEGEAALPMGSLDLVADGFASAGILDERSASTLLTGNFAYRGGLSLAIASGPRLRLRAGVRVLGYENDQQDGAADLPAKTASYVAPLFDLSLRTTPTFEIFARTLPDVEANGLAALYTATPYLADEPTQRATLRTVDAEAGVALFVGGVRLSAFAHGMEAPSFRYFETAEGGVQSAFAGRIVPRYDDARIYGVGGSVAIAQPDGLSASAEVRYQIGTLTDVVGEPEVPYLSPIEARLSASLPLVAGRALVQMGARFASARPYSLRDAEEVSAFATANASVSYRVTPALAVVAEAANLSAGALEYWRGYPQEGPLVTLGVRALW